jgi:hypothetical protein
VVNSSRLVVCLSPTEAATPWLADQDLEDAPVITGNRKPDEPKRIPPADAVAVVPITFNTLNAWANGNANTYPLTTLCAALGSRTPTVAVPFARRDLAGHPAWLASLAVLRYAGAKIIDPNDGATSSSMPVHSGTGQTVSDSLDWDWFFRNLTRTCGYYSSRRSWPDAAHAPVARSAIEIS